MHQSWLARLGSQTAAYHAAADAQRLSIIDAGSTTRYRALLERVYGFESAVERRASSIAGVGPAVAGARTRIGRLHHDLSALGMSELDIAALPQASIDARSVSDGLGWLFVIQRHVLLAGLIRRVLASELGAVPCGYFATHADGGTQLREFGEVLADCIMRASARPAAILSAARRAFEQQFQWYSRPERRAHRLEPRDAA